MPISTRRPVPATSASTRAHEVVCDRAIPVQPRVAGVKPTDIAHLITLGTPTLSPDGRTAVVAAVRPDLDEDEYRSQLWSVAARRRAPPRRLTHGEHDTAPRYSPDGRWLAFLRAEPEGKPQLHVLPTDGGDARALTDLPGGAGAPRWSPDSTRDRVQRPRPRGRPVRAGREDHARQGAAAPHHRAAVPPRRRRVHSSTGASTSSSSTSTATASRTPADRRRLRHGDRRRGARTAHGSPSSRPATSAREHDHASDVFVVRPRRRRTCARSPTPRCALGAPAFTPDGATIAAAAAATTARDGSGWSRAAGGLYAVDVERRRPRRAGSPTPRRTTSSSDRIVVDGERALVAVENRGAVDLLAVPFDGCDADADRRPGGACITGVDAAGDTVVVELRRRRRRSGEVGVLRRRRRARAHRLRRDLRAHAAPRPIIELDRRRAGRPAAARLPRRARGRRTAPGAADDPRRPVRPVRAGRVFDEAQVYAGAGYAVVYANPRGSSGLRRSVRPATSAATSASARASTCSPCSTTRSSVPSWTRRGSACSAARTAGS